MTLVSLVQASRRLGVDSKTLHHWLAQAQLSVQHDPQDGRKKGISLEHLHLLARLHQRRLALEADLSAPASGPADLLALPDLLATMQMQLDALRAEVTRLSRLLDERQSPPALPPPAAPPPTSPKPTIQPPRKPVHVIARVEYGADGRYLIICPKQGRLPLQPDTPEWFAWLAEQSSFRFVGPAGYFTAHHEERVPNGAWRAHRHIRNHSYIHRLAPSHEVTIAVLEQAAQALQAHLT